MSESRIEQIRRAPIRLLLFMEGISSLANQLFQVLLPWYILGATGSVGWMGVAAFATIAPGIPASLWGGKVIDRFGRAPVMFACEIIQFFLIALIPVLIFTGKAYPALISAIVCLSAFFDMPGALARQALMPTFSRWAGAPLHKTTGINEAIAGIMSVFGPLAGGVIIGLYGTFNAWICMTLLCLIIVIIAVFFYQKRKPKKAFNHTTYLQAARAVKEDKFLMQAIIFTMPLFILGESWELLILPTFVHTFSYTSVFLGALEAAFGLASFAGALYFSSKGKRLNFFTLLIINYFAYIFSIFVLMYNLPKIVIIAATFLSGLPFGAFCAAVITALLSKSLPELRGKTLGLFSACAALTESVFILLIGFLLQYKGLFFTLSAIIIVFIIIAAAAIFARRLNEIAAR
jgi:macrolide resistance protein